MKPPVDAEAMAAEIVEIGRETATIMRATQKIRDLKAALAASQARVEELTEALHDAIVRSCGVVPESAQAFYSPASAIRAEARRPPFGSSQDRQERHYVETRAFSPEPRS